MWPPKSPKLIILKAKSWDWAIILQLDTISPTILGLMILLQKMVGCQSMCARWRRRMLQWSAWRLEMGGRIEEPSKSEITTESWLNHNHHWSILTLLFGHVDWFDWLACLVCFCHIFQWSMKNVSATTSRTLLGKDQLILPWKTMKWSPFASYSVFWGGLLWINLCPTLLNYCACASFLSNIFARIYSTFFPCQIIGPLSTPW